MSPSNAVIIYLGISTVPSSVPSIIEPLLKFNPVAETVCPEALVDSSVVPNSVTCTLKWVLHTANTPWSAVLWPAEWSPIAFGWTSKLPSLACASAYAKVTILSPDAS